VLSDGAGRALVFGTLLRGRAGALTGHVGGDRQRDPPSAERGLHKLESVGFSLASFHEEIKPR